MRMGCLYLIKPTVVGFCLRYNWIMGSRINVLTDLISILLPNRYKVNN